MIHKYSFFFIGLILSFEVLALPLVHQTRPHFSFSQIATLDACGVYKGRKDSVNCNPALFKSSSYEGLVFFIASKTDGDSVDSGVDLLFKPIEEDTLRDIFELNAFSSWDANSAIEFRTSLFYISYEPIFATANFYLYNPAFPEVSLNTSSQRRINVASGEEFRIGAGNKISVGGNIFYYERTEYNGTFALLEVSSKETGELLTFKDSHGIQADLGFMYENEKLTWIPKASLILRNLGSDVSIDDENAISETRIESFLLYEQYSKFDLGYDFDFTFGAVGLNVSLPFSGAFEEYYSDYSALSLNYSLWDLELMGGYSQYNKVLGLKFASKSNSIGVYYGESSNLGDFSDVKENYAGISLEIYL